MALKLGFGGKMFPLGRSARITQVTNTTRDAERKPLALPDERDPFWAWGSQRRYAFAWAIVPVGFMLAVIWGECGGKISAFFTSVVDRIEPPVTRVHDADDNCLYIIDERTGEAVERHCDFLNSYDGEPRELQGLRR